MFAPGVVQVASEFGEHNKLLDALVVSIYVIGLAVGPLVQAPMSEVYGRWIVYATCNVLYVVFTIACAVSTNMSMLIVFRFFAGCLGSAPVTIGGGTIADLFPPHQRGVALSIYTLGPVAGPAIGPIAGGFLSENEGWKWIFWVLAIAVRTNLPCKGAVTDSTIEWSHYRWPDIPHTRDERSRDSPAQSQKAAKRNRKYEPPVEAR